MGLFDRARRSPIRRTADGTYAVDLDPEVRQMISSFIEQLRELLSTDSSLLVRLFPPPYGDDTERNQGYAALAGAELMERRTAALDVVRDSIDATALDEGQLMAWMRAINDIRLVMGTMLDVDDAGEPGDLSPDDAATYSVYEYFGAMLELIVAALSD
ncbi:MAG: DUF2017 family protein [Microthrixaceae bacterium]